MDSQKLQDWLQVIGVIINQTFPFAFTLQANACVGEALNAVTTVHFVVVQAGANRIIVHVNESGFAVGEQSGNTWRNISAVHQSFTLPVFGPDFQGNIVNQGLWIGPGGLPKFLFKFRVVTKLIDGEPIVDVVRESLTCLP